MIRIPEPAISAVPLDQLARSAVRLAAVDCVARGIEITFEPGCGEAVVQVDPIQFEQVLLNIIKNARESIGQDGRITVRTDRTPLSISITDNGRGIDPPTAGKLFTPFFSTKPDGQGVGLMFVKEVLSNHGCRFSLSTEDGMTTFNIVFPTLL